MSSDSLKRIEDNDDRPLDENPEEPLDPRIQIELERANAATSDINNLETQLDNAQKYFQSSFTHYKQCLAKLVKTNARSIERARPYYDACQRASAAQLDTQQAAHDYQYSVENYHTAQENLLLAQRQTSQSDVQTWQDYVEHATLQVTQAEGDKRRCEQLHEERSKRYQDYEQQRLSLSRSLKRSIVKSKSYFDLKQHAEEDLKNQKLRIEDVQKAIRQAKSTYRTALNCLEEISEEIHNKRQNSVTMKLPLREPTIGLERTDPMIEIPLFELSEFPPNNLSDEGSDTEVSTPIHSLSINDLSRMSSNERSTSTNSIPQSLTNLTTSKSVSYFLAKPSPLHSSNASNNVNQSVQSQQQIRPSKRLMSTHPIPLLSHLSRMQSYPSDPTLHVQTKR